MNLLILQHSQPRVYSSFSDRTSSAPYYQITSAYVRLLMSETKLRTHAKWKVKLCFHNDS